MVSFEVAADPGTRITAKAKIVAMKINSIGFIILVSPETAKIFLDLILSIAKLWLSCGKREISSCC